MRLEGVAAALARMPDQPPWRLHAVAETDSTNRRLLEALEGGGPLDRPWTVLTAEAQTAGRGRHERHWDCPAGEGLLVSLRLDLDLERHHLSLVGHWAALALARVLARSCQGAEGDARVWWKWPNDLLLEDGAGAGKVAGLLVQTRIVGSRAHVVVGLGLNLGQRTFPPGLRQPARSLAQGGVAVEREELLAAWLGELGGRGLPARPAPPPGLAEADLLASRPVWIRDGERTHRLADHEHLADGRLRLAWPGGGALLADGGLRLEELRKEGMWCRLEA
ncbi:MAG: biotin--[acetyl-CoA-carboxylase] ligase [bacterium]|nr:biotin--[acetyl-CoA-carboxylase] ligase [bacterium]